MFRTLQSNFGHIWARKARFFSVFFVVTIITYGVLFAFDFIPEAPENNEVAGIDDFLSESEIAQIAQQNQIEVGDTQDTAFVGTDATPDKIIIDKLNKEVAILNPNTRIVSELDHALLSGTVRHPDSADLLSEGTVFLFGHSSALPTVFNQNFRAFNGIQNLEWGDIIRIQSSDAEYVYRVDRVYQAKASTAEIVIETDSRRLTLATCNSFGSHDDRHIVESTLVEVRPLST